jgi:aldehyde dehydrogenase (NAD+)
MKKEKINQIYVDGKFVNLHGKETIDLINPTTNEKMGEVVLGDEVDTQIAIAAAKEAFKTFRKTSKAERITYLQKLYESVSKREEELIRVMVEEYGGTLQFCKASTKNAIGSFANMIETLQKFDFEKRVGQSKVRLEPVGIMGIITP